MIALTTAAGGSTSGSSPASLGKKKKAHTNILPHETETVFGTQLGLRSCPRIGHGWVTWNNSFASVWDFSSGYVMQLALKLLLLVARHAGSFLLLILLALPIQLLQSVLHIFTFTLMFPVQRTLLPTPGKLPAHQL
ncbi:hypothetical protein Pelo_8485 [Pelomyxa schiedti]|nr:hypothetical protein Pelo_8485 [Pelomyxa schiedti]